MIVVVCDEPNAIADAYAFIKCMSELHAQSRFHVVANMVDGTEHGHNLFGKLLPLTDQSLNVTLQFLGPVPADLRLSDAVRAQRAVCELYPDSSSSNALNTIAERISRWPSPTSPSGRLECFVERLFGRTGVPLEAPA